MKIYTRDDCPFCEKLVTVLNKRSISFEKLELDEDFSREEFIDMFGYGATFPRVVVDDVIIGGLKETAQYLINSSK